ncbi:MAG: S8 family serine peptidase, partial [Thermoplasmata archaeon]|nr:S8 family serine peptidase [Thermoplasmata archaeon]
KSGLPQIICGDGQRVGIQDTGTSNVHWDFQQGWGGDRYAAGSEDDIGSNGIGHGTHCGGIIAGNGFCMETWLAGNGAPCDPNDRVYYDPVDPSYNPYGPDREGFAGVAPEAVLEAHRPLGTGDWNTMSASGCVAISNSWGPGGAPTSNYGTDSGTADTLMVGNTQILVIFAAGNAGPRSRTLGGAANSWQGLCVAASENFRPEGYASSDDPNQLIEFSSRGPMTSGRIKPDISAIGTMVASTKWDAEAFDEYDDIYRDYIIDEGPNAGVADYRFMSGTSMACPHIAGHVTLINDYLEDIEGYTNPNRVLTKVILLNGAIDMGYGYPNFEAGWGRVNIKNSLVPDAPRTNQWAEGSLSTGGTWNFTSDGGANTYVESDRVPLKIMLCWDMPSGAAMSNDYELEVTSPSGVVYKGNCFDRTGHGRNADWSQPDPNAAFWNTLGSPTSGPPYGFDFDTDDDNDDDINNVEAVFVEMPEVGTWTVQVRADSTPNTPRFAVAWGADTGGVENYQVELTTEYPTIFSAAQGGTATFPFNILNFGTLADSIQFSDDADADLTVTYSETTPLALGANEDRDIIAQVSAAGGAAIGVHKFTITGLSLDDPGSPPSQDTIELKVEVLAEAVPVTYQITTDPMSQYSPSVVAFTDGGGTDHVIIAYSSEEQEVNGYRVF